MLVDDEELIIESLTYSLKREGFEVQAVGTGSDALDSIDGFNPDLIVLDIMLPDFSGIEVCRRLRSHSAVPVIMLTARGEEIDRVLGLEVGADDYLAKPFSFRELLARIRAILRRVELDSQVSGQEQFTVGDIHVDIIAHKASKGEQVLDLSSREFDLLRTLIQSAGAALSRDKLLDSVWGKIGSETPAP